MKAPLTLFMASCIVIIDAKCRPTLYLIVLRVENSQNNAVMQHEEHLCVLFFMLTLLKYPQTTVFSSHTVRGSYRQ